MQENLTYSFLFFRKSMKDVSRQLVCYYLCEISPIFLKKLLKTKIISLDQKNFDPNQKSFVKTTKNFLPEPKKNSCLNKKKI